jgi:hypothetical protein
MPSEQPSRLAAEGSQALVAAMPNPAWPALREQAVEVLHGAGPGLEGVLVPELDVNARMLAAADPEHLAVLRAMLVSRWTENLARVLAEHPASDEALRRLVEHIAAAIPATERASRTMTNVAKGHSTLFAVMDGNLIQHHYEKPGPSGRPAGGTRDASPPEDDEASR